MHIARRSGFTLIELSIVLVIIGLLAGGILVGRDLIEAAAIRAQVSQIEKYDAAVNTFRTKYNYLPGDIPQDQASATGLFPRSGNYGDGDGNGYINSKGDLIFHSTEQAGEPLLFWTDLSAAGLIDGSFTQPTVATNVYNDQMPMYLPQAKIGRGYVVVYGSGEQVEQAGPTDAFPLENNYQLVEFNPPATGLAAGGYTYIAGGPLTPLQAQAIDQKTDDGYPLTGRVTAMYGGEDTGNDLNISLKYLLWQNGGFWPPYTDCIANTTPISYDTADSTKANQDICSLRIKAGF